MLRKVPSAMPRDEIGQPFYLIVADHDRAVFSVEGPMADDRSWTEAAKFARNNQHRITCGPTGPDRDALAAEFRRTRACGRAAWQHLEAPAMNKEVDFDAKLKACRQHGSARETEIRNAHVQWLDPSTCRRGPRAYSRRLAITRSVQPASPLILAMARHVRAVCNKGIVELNPPIMRRHRTSRRCLRHWLV